MNFKELLSTTWLVIALCTVAVVPQSGGTFEITKSVIAGGGGQSTGGAFTLDGTIGQSIAGTNSTGGTFGLTGGFWGGQAAPVSSVTVSGRVLTVLGNGLRNVIVSMTDPQGVVLRATTSSGGNFNFDNVQTGQAYVLTVASKRFRFSPQIIQINSTITNLEFRGLE